MSVDDKLGLDLFHTDEHNPHITVNEDYDDMEEIRKVLLASPHGRRRCSVPSGLMPLQNTRKYSRVNN